MQGSDNNDSLSDENSLENHKQVSKAGTWHESKPTFAVTSRTKRQVGQEV